LRDGHPEVMLGELLANSMNKKTGDTLPIQGSLFKVVAVTTAGLRWSRRGNHALDQLQRLSSLQGKVSTIHVRLRPAPSGEAPDEYLKRAQAQIEAALPDCAQFRRPSAREQPVVRLAQPLHGARLRLRC